MSKIRTIKNIMPPYNKSLIYTRLGYNKNITDLSSEVEQEMERDITKAERFLDITVAYRIMDIVEVEPPMVILKDGTVFSGYKLSDLMATCTQVLLMAATGGKKIMDLISELQAIGKMSEAVVVDAVASEITDSGLDLVMAMINQQLKPQGRFLTKMRFSPGYGDFDICQQKDFYRLLEGESLGITLNQYFMLIPEKSVFAIAGVSEK